MSARRIGVLLAFVAAGSASACASPPTCPDAPPEPVLDAGEVPDAGPDTGVGIDAGPPACDAIEPTRLYIGRAWFAMAPAMTVDCMLRPPPGGDVRVRLYRAGETTVVYDSAPAGVPGCYGFLGSFERGEYDVVVESLGAPEWIVGAALVRPESCVGPAATLPHCRPFRLVLSECREQGFFVALHCDPAAGTCPAGPWPWTTP